MGFVRVAENHRRAKAARERAEAEAAAREARRIPVLTCQPKPPESVRLLDRIYRPVVEKQLKRRAARQEQEKMVPEQLRQWRWARLNPGLDQYGFVRADRSLASFERCPICHSNEGHGLHRLHLGRHTVAELRHRAELGGAPPEALRGREGETKAQRKEALVNIVMEQHRFKQETMDSWRAHTRSLKSTGRLFGAYALSFTPRHRFACRRCRGA